MKRTVTTVTSLFALMLAGVASAATINVPADPAAIQTAIDGASAGDIIQVAAGVCVVPSQINVNKAVTIQGAGSASTVFLVSGTGYRFYISAAGAALQDVQIQKTDKTGLQNIVYISANNVSIRSNLIWGQFVVGDGDTTRAVEIAGGLTGLVIDGNTIHNLRQPAYINRSSGAITNNYVYATKGWVISDGSSMTFTGNSWGTGGQANAVDIAIIVDSPSTPPPGFYGDIGGMRLANNNARIDDQRTPAYVKYVDAAGGSDANEGRVDTPYKTVGRGIAQIVAGGTVVVAPGDYAAEYVTVSKAVKLVGANAGIHPAVGTHPTEAAGARGSESILSNLSPQADGITVDGFKFLKAGTRIIDTYANANSFHLTNCIVQSTTFGATTGAVQFGGGSHTDVVIDFNLFQDKGEHTLYLSGGPYDRLRLAYNRVNVQGDAVFWAAGPLVDGVIEANEFDGTIDGVPGSGFAEMNIGQGGNIAIRDNWFHDQQYTAFQVGIVDGSITGNLFERIFPYAGGLPGNAFELWGGQWGTAVSTSVTIACNTIRYNDVPGASYPTHGIRLRAPESGAGIDGSTIHVANNTFDNGGARTDAYAIRHQGDPASVVDADGNWWGTTNGSAIGALMSGNVNYAPWLTKPAPCGSENVVYLVPTDESIYIKPTETCILDMDVANLQQMVAGVQTMLHFSSTYFSTGAADVSVGPGGSTVWDAPAYYLYGTSGYPGSGNPGDLDAIITVNANAPLGTDQDATVAIIGLKPVSEGVTQVVFRPDLVPDPGLTKSTFFSDMSGNPVWPAKLNSTSIYIDGHAPTVDSFSAAPLCTKTTTTLTFAVSDDNAGVDYVDVYVGTSMVAHAVTSPCVLDMSGYATGCYDVTIKVVDKAGNEATSSTISVCVDQAAPAISNIRAEQGASSVLCPDNAAQGVVDVYVDVTDDGCADLVVPPTVEIAGIAPVSYMGMAGDTYHYQVTVLATTANGSHAITVTAADTLGNSSSDNSQAICVDKNQAGVTVTFATLRSSPLSDPPSPADYTFNRAVTFVATDAGGAMLKTWTPTLSFTNDPATQTASASYALTNVPAGMVHLSAKTAWHLRKRLDVTLDESGQATAAFTLLGGDLNESNSVNILDYSILKAKWQTDDTVADINGDGQVQGLDYSLMKSNWFNTGDPQ
jgi:hypothetical protein